MRGAQILLKFNEEGTAIMFRSNTDRSSSEAARHAKLGTLIEHKVTDGESTELKVVTGPAHEGREVVYSHYVQSVKGTSGISIENASNGVIIKINAVVPIREVIAKVNNRRHGKLRVAVFLKSDRQGNSYFEVHTPKDSYTDVARSTFDIERDQMKPVCPHCGSADCPSAQLREVFDEMGSGMFGLGGLDELPGMSALFGLGGLDRSRSGRVSFEEILQMARDLYPSFDPFGDDDLDNEAANHEAATSAASNGNGHAASSNGNGHAASNGNGTSPKKKSGKRKKRAGKNERNRRRKGSNVSNGNGAPMRRRSRQVVTE
ncbi:hypothetical protein HN801_03845 [Candidatus Peregrinibacteria bacterium]|nr:hypothetical protein [Candidatus Peregrinibacteria bacterium]